MELGDVIPVTDHVVDHGIGIPAHGTPVRQHRPLRSTREYVPSFSTRKDNRVALAGIFFERPRYG